MVIGLTMGRLLSGDNETQRSQPPGPSLGMGVLDLFGSVLWTVLSSFGNQTPGSVRTQWAAQVSPSSPLYLSSRGAL